MQAFNSGVVPSRSKHRDATWLRWNQYCAQLGIDPMLQNVVNPIMVLQVFAARYLSGEIAPGGNIMRSCTVEAALRAIGETMASVGARDPCYTTQGQFHYCIQQQIKGYTHQDPPAVRVKPIPFTIITHALTNAHSTLDQAIADMAVAGWTSPGSRPFT
jgi:hypothetical protein